MLKDLPRLHSETSSSSLSKNIRVSRMNTEAWRDRMTCLNRQGSKPRNQGGLGWVCGGQAAPRRPYRSRGWGVAEPPPPPARSPRGPGSGPRFKPLLCPGLPRLPELGAWLPGLRSAQKSSARPQAAVSSGDNPLPTPRAHKAFPLLQLPLTLHGHDPGPGPQSRLRAWSQMDRDLGAGHGWPGSGGPAAPVW